MTNSEGQKEIEKMLRHPGERFDLLVKFTEAALTCGAYGGDAVSRAEEAYSALLRLYPIEDDVSDRVEVQRRAGIKSPSPAEREMINRWKQFTGMRVTDIIGVYK